jgi:hypothetical protein
VAFAIVVTKQKFINLLIACYVCIEN